MYYICIKHKHGISYWTTKGWWGIFRFAFPFNTEELAYAQLTLLQNRLNKLSYQYNYMFVRKIDNVG